jgi:hypothetical protein
MVDLSPLRAGWNKLYSRSYRILFKKNPLQRKGIIFISYRHEDTAQFAHRLYDGLASYYGRSNIVIDEDSFETGREFPEIIRESIQHCRILLILVGDKWEGNSNGTPRIEDPGDWVRKEIETALEYRRIMFPIYVGNRSVLTADRLPASINFIPRLQSLRVYHQREFHSHLRGLVRDIDSALYPSSGYRNLAKSMRFVEQSAWTLLSVVLMACLGALAWFAVILAQRVPSTGKMVQALTYHDAQNFAGSSNGRYEVARALAGREALERDTAIVATVRATKKTFDFFAERGNVLSVTLQDPILES